MFENIEKESTLISAIENYAHSIIPPDVTDTLNKIDSDLVKYFNPETIGSKTPTTEYLMSSFSSAAFVGLFYLGSVLLLAMILRIINPKPYQPTKARTSLLEKFADEPLQLFAMVYNIIQVLACGYMAYRSLEVVLNDNYDLVCNKHDLSNERMAKVHWLFYMSKILDFFDTYMIILRRKWRQLSFLHVYHHFSVFMFQWLYNRTGYDGDMWFVIFANVSVHCVMYFYYFLRTIDIQVPIFLKKMITNMQLFQFTCMMAQAIYVYNNNCEYPGRLLILYFFYIASLFMLFLNFFIVNYLTKAGKKKKKTK